MCSLPSFLGPQGTLVQVNQVYDSVTAGLQGFYRSKLLPIEKDHLFHQFYSPELTDTRCICEKKTAVHGGIIQAVGLGSLNTKQ